MPARTTPATPRRGRDAIGLGQLSWIVHDQDEHDRVQQLLAALGQSEARDELGIGAIRDSIADLLFPGTTTIQTRLRYFLIVPWGNLHLESQHLRPPAFGRRADALERDLIDRLRDQDDVAGAFGRVAGRKLKRLPSSVYWAGLGDWGLRLLPWSRADYHDRVDRLYALRATERHGGDGRHAGAAAFWYRGIPAPPRDFPARIDLETRREEAEFLVERLGTAPGTRGSLLELLARQAWTPTPKQRFAWEIDVHLVPSPDIRALLHHARLFSELMWGAALLYNRTLAELDAPAGRERERRDEIASARTRQLAEWRADVLRLPALRAWSPDEFRQTLDDLRRAAAARHPAGSHHNIHELAWRFVGAWYERVLATKGNVEDDPAARALVRTREESVKGARGRSRFHNPRLRQSWGGAAGIGRLDFRWDVTKGLLRDLAAGLARS